MRKSTVRPTRVSTVRETIVLETPKATVTRIDTARDNRDREWLARDVFSTPYATILES
jgi:hypothetical protein